MKAAQETVEETKKEVAETVEKPKTNRRKPRNPRPAGEYKREKKVYIAFEGGPADFKAENATTFFSTGQLLVGNEENNYYLVAYNSDFGGFSTTTPVSRKGAVKKDIFKADAVIPILANDGTLAGVKSVVAKFGANFEDVVKASSRKKLLSVQDTA